MPKKFDIIDTQVRVIPPDLQKKELVSPKEAIYKKILGHPNFLLHEGLMDLKGLIHSMDEASIDKAWVMGLAWINPEYNMKNNLYVKFCCMEYPDRLSGFWMSDLSKESSIKEIECLPENFIGVKVTPGWHEYHIDDPECKYALETMSEKEIPLFLHVDHPIQEMDMDAPLRLLRIARRHPRLRIICAHMGGSLFMYELLENISNDLENVYYVTSTSATMKMVKWALEICPKKLFFGTDFPFNHCRSQVKCLMEFSALRVKNKIAVDILSKNAERFLQDLEIEH